MPLYLVDYIGNGSSNTPWRPRGSDQPGWSAIKLGKGGPQAKALLWLPTLDVQLGANKLADYKYESLAVASRQRVESVLGVVTDSKAVTPASLIYTLLVSPPGGKWNPLRPTNGYYEVWLGGERWVTVPASQSSLPVAIGALASRLTRRQLLQLGSIGALALIASKAWAASYSTDFAGTENPLSEGGQWSSGEGNGEPHEKSSGRVRGTTVGSRDTSRLTLTVGANHYGQAGVYLTDIGTLVAVGLVCRMVGGVDESAYVAEAFINGGTPGSQIYEWSNDFGTTTLATGGPTFASADVLKHEAVGSSLTLTKNGSSPLNATDTTLTGGYIGIYSFTGGATTAAELDDFLGGDVSNRRGTLMGVYP